MNIQEQHTAGAQLLGFDYQLYYFMLLALELKSGEKIGFEVKDDIHIEKKDGKTILFQAKHTIQENKNLTTLDSDLWKTLSNWVDFGKTETDFFKNHSFVLVTNKNDNDNQFITVLSQFKQNQDVDSVKTILTELKDKTINDTIKKYINNVNSLPKSNLKLFLSNLTIETDTTNIIYKVKSKILETIRQKNLVDTIYDSLVSNIQTTKYLDITNGCSLILCCKILFVLNV